MIIELLFNVFDDMQIWGPVIVWPKVYVQLIRLKINNNNWISRYLQNMNAMYKIQLSFI